MSESTSNTNKYLIAGLVLALLLSGFLLVQNINLKEQVATCSKEVDQSETARQAVIDELNTMEAEYSKLSEQNEEMSTELLAEKEKIEQLLKEAKNKNWSISKLKKETETLREIMKGYLVTIDSLNTLNQELNTENIAVKGELADQKTANSSLSKQNESLSEKVKIGSLLQAVNVNYSAQIKKNSGALKQTSKASRADVIKACFTIPSNSIASAGNKTIYMRVIGPFGSVLGGKQDDGFVVNGRKGIYTYSKEFNYTKTAQDQCLHWDVTDPLTKGNYLISLYCEGRELHSSKLILD